MHYKTDVVSAALFRYLIIAEIRGDSEYAWHEYILTWDKLNKKYAQ